VVHGEPGVNSSHKPDNLLPVYLHSPPDWARADKSVGSHRLNQVFSTTYKTRRVRRIEVFAAEADQVGRLGIPSKVVKRVDLGGSVSNDGHIMCVSDLYNLLQGDGVTLVGLN
jgi:hypothetical protein